MLTESASASSVRPYPTTLDCVEADEVVCTYRIVSEDELAAGFSLALRSNAGRSPPDRIEVERLDAGHIDLVVYYPFDRDLQGVSLQQR